MCGIRCWLCHRKKREERTSAADHAGLVGADADPLARCGSLERDKMHRRSVTGVEDRRHAAPLHHESRPPCGVFGGRLAIDGGKSPEEVLRRTPSEARGVRGHPACDRLARRRTRLHGPVRTWWRLARGRGRHRDECDSHHDQEHARPAFGTLCKIRAEGCHAATFRQEVPK